MGCVKIALVFEVVSDLLGMLLHEGQKLYLIVAVEDLLLSVEDEDIDEMGQQALKAFAVIKSSKGVSPI